MVDRVASAEGLAVRDVPSVAASDLRADAIRREGEGGLAAGRRAEDVQLLVVSGHRGMCPGLVFLPISHARL